MQELLDYLGLAADAKLGEDVHAVTYALDSDRLVRVYGAEAGEAIVSRRKALLDEIQAKASSVRFALPSVLDVVERGGVCASIEPRLKGRPLDDALRDELPDRRQLLRSYLESSRQIGELTPQRSWYGDLLREDAIHTQSFQEYVLARTHDSLRRAGAPFDSVRVFDIADALPEAPGSLVHMHFCPSNVLVDGNQVTAISDISEVAIIGDRRIDAVSAAIFLDARLTPSATDEDREFARTWLVSHQLDSFYEPVTRWLAAFWCSMAGPGFDAWCRAALGV